jgi:hypothetical protein
VGKSRHRGHPAYCPRSAGFSECCRTGARHDPTIGMALPLLQNETQRYETDSAFRHYIRNRL